MSAGDALSGGQFQLKMFMTPPEIKHFINQSVDRQPLGTDASWYAKESPTMQESIRRQGVKTPVVIQLSGDSRMMGNGHHRVENAHIVQQETGHEVYVPVAYSHDFMGISSGMRRVMPGVYRAGQGYDEGTTGRHDDNDRDDDYYDEDYDDPTSHEFTANQELDDRGSSARVTWSQGRRYHVTTNTQDSAQIEELDSMKDPMRNVRSLGSAKWTPRRGWHNS